MVKPDGSLNPFRKFLYYHLPVIVFAALIFLVSSIPNLRTPRIRFLTLDKVAHFIEYAVFSFLTFRSFSNFGKWMTPTRAMLLSGLFLCLFAALDEYHQSFVRGRTSDVYDLLTDVAGAFLVLLYLRLRNRQSAKIQAPEQ
jgi:VanZ family protein